MSRLGWKTRISIRHLLSDDDDLSAEQITAIGKQIATILKNCESFMEVFEAKQIVYDLERADNYDDFNEQLDAMYDVCDGERIWVG